MKIIDYIVCFVCFLFLITSRVTPRCHYCAITPLYSLENMSRMSRYISSMSNFLDARNTREPLRHQAPVLLCANRHFPAALAQIPLAV